MRKLSAKQTGEREVRNFRMELLIANRILKCLKEKGDGI